MNYFLQKWLLQIRSCYKLKKNYKVIFLTRYVNLIWIKITFHRWIRGMENNLNKMHIFFFTKFKKIFNRKLYFMKSPVGNEKSIHFVKKRIFIKAQNSKSYYILCILLKSRYHIFPLQRRSFRNIYVFLRDKESSS